jgi:hypothetical protein
VAQAAFIFAQVSQAQNDIVESRRKLDQATRLYNELRPEDELDFTIITWEHVKQLIYYDFF